MPERSYKTVNPEVDRFRCFIKGCGRFHSGTVTLKRGERSLQVLSLRCQQHAQEAFEAGHERYNQWFADAHPDAPR